MADNILLNFGNYCVNNGGKKTVRFRWALVWNHDQLVAENADGMDVDPAAVLLPGPDDTFDLWAEGISKVDGKKISKPVKKLSPDDIVKFSLYQLGMPNPNNGNRVSTPPDQSNVERKRLTAKQMLSEFHPTHNPPAIADLMARHMEQSIKATATGMGAAPQGAQMDQILQTNRSGLRAFAVDLYAQVAKRYRGRRTDFNLAPRQAEVFGASALANTFVGRTAAAINHHVASGAIHPMLRGPVAAAAMVAAEAADKPSQAQKTLVIAIASGATIETFVDDNASSGEVKPIGELVAVEVSVDAADPLFDDFRASDSSVRVTMHLKWNEKDGRTVEAKPIPDALNDTLPRPEQHMNEEFAASFVEDGYFRRIVEKGHGPANDDPFVFTPTAGDGLISLQVSGIATARAAHSAFVIVRRKIGDPKPIVDVVKQENPITPQDLSVFQGNVWYLPPRSPDGHGGIRENRQIAFHETIYEDPATGNIVAEMTVEDLYRLTPDPSGKPPVDKLKRDRRPPLGQVFRYWIFARAMDGQWNPDPREVRRVADRGFALPDLGLPNDVKDVAFPVLSAQSPDAPPLRAEADDDANKEFRALTLVRDSAARKSRATVTVYDRRYRSEVGIPHLPRYSDWHGIDQLHVLLFRRVPKVDLSAAISIGGMGLMDEDEAYYRRQKWFQDLTTANAELKANWIFYGLSKHARGSNNWNRAEDGKIELVFSDATGPKLVDTGWEYLAVVVAKRPSKLCFQVPQEGFPVVRMEVTKPPPQDPANASPLPLADEPDRKNGIEPPKSLVDAGNAPVRFEYSKPAMTVAAYGAASIAPPAPPAQGTQAVDQVRAVRGSLYRVSGLNPVPGMRDCDVVTLLSTASDNAKILRRHYRDGIFKRIRRPGENVPSGVAADSSFGTKLLSWLDEHLEINNAAGKPEIFRARVASTVGMRGIFAVSDDNADPTFAPEAYGIPIVGMRWTRMTRHEYADFTAMVELNLDDSHTNLLIVDGLDGLPSIPSATGSSAQLGSGRALVELFMPGRKNETGFARSAQYYRALLDVADADALRSVLPTGQPRRLPVDRLRDVNGQPPLLSTTTPDRVWGVAHVGSEYTIANGQITFNTPPQIIPGNEKVPGMLIVVELWNPREQRGQRLFREIRPEHLNTADGKTLLVALDLPKEAQLPTSGWCRFALVRDKGVVTTGYGRNLNGADVARGADERDPADWIDVIESDQEDEISYSARFLNPGERATSNAQQEPTALPQAGPASFWQLKLVSSIVPPTPRIAAITAKPWNISIQWATEQQTQSADGRTHRERIYDDSNWIQIHATVKELDPFDDDALGAGALTLPEALEQLRRGDWSRFAEAEMLIRDWFAAPPDGNMIECNQNGYYCRQEILVDGQLDLAGSKYALISGEDKHRRENNQWEFKFRMLENYVPGQSASADVLCSEWTDTLGPARPLALIPAVEGTVTERVHLTSPPSTRINVTMMARFRALTDFPLPGHPGMYYRLVVRKGVASPEPMPGDQPGYANFITTTVADRICYHGAPIAAQQGSTVDFAYEDPWVTAESVTRPDFVYRYELELQHCVRTRLGRTVVVSRSDSYVIRLAPGGGVGVRPQREVDVVFGERLPDSDGALLPAPIPATPRASLREKLIGAGWMQTAPGVFQLPKSGAVDLPFAVAHAARDKDSLVLGMLQEEPLTFAVLEGADFNPKTKQLTVANAATLYVA